MAYVQLRLFSVFFILSINLCLELNNENSTKLDKASDASRVVATFHPRGRNPTKKGENKQTNRESRRAFVSWSRHLRENSDYLDAVYAKRFDNPMTLGLTEREMDSNELPQLCGQHLNGSAGDSHAEKLVEERRNRPTRAVELLNSERRNEVEESIGQASGEFGIPSGKNDRGISDSSLNFPYSERLTKTGGFEIRSHVSRQMKKNPSCTDTSGLDLDLAQAVADVIRTITVSHLYLVSQSETSDCLLEKLWLQSTATEVLGVSQWWSRVSRLTYRSYSQHVLLGSVEWITAVMDKIRLFYDNSSVNAMHTKWIWVVFDLNSSDPVSPPRPPSSVEPTSVVKKVSKTLKEGMRGVLVFRERKINSAYSSEKSQEFGENGQIKVAAVVTSGDGSWNLAVASIWSAGTLKKFSPLWPKPAFNFQNRTIRVSCINKPMVFEYQEGHGLEAATGYLSDVMRIAQVRLNFTDVLLPTVGFGTPEPNGSWNGMIGAVNRKEADMSPLDFSPSYARSLVVEFGVPVSEDVLIIVSKAPSVIIKPFLILQIFSPSAWASIVAGGLFIELVVEFMLRTESTFDSSEKQRSTITHTLGNILRTLVGQPCEDWPPRDGARVAITSGLFMSLVLGSLYKGFITAFLAIPFRSKPLDSAEDLLVSKTRPALREQTQFVETLVFAEYGVFHPVRDKVRLFSESYISSDEFFEKVADGTFALADSYSSAIGRAKQFERRGKKCRFYVGKVPLRTDLDVFAFTQNSPFLYAFDDTMKWLRFFGIIDYFRNRYIALPCIAEVSSDDPEPMTLNQIQGCLYVLGIGLAVSSVAFVLESLWPKVTRGILSKSQSPDP
ncbi:uncharacterized protein [Macrobrachium rosenbergii]|uniref:uncharacterized protein n=1 Tax=Macrobrachium rosenbergii TaxID=79674 RepID=UPI0034D4BC40